MLADLSAFALVFCVMFTLLCCLVLFDAPSRHALPNAAGDVLATVACTVTGLVATALVTIKAPLGRPGPLASSLIAGWILCCLVVVGATLVGQLKDRRDPEVTTR